HAEDVPVRVIEKRQARVRVSDSRLWQRAMRSVLSIWPSVLLPPIRGEAGWGAPDRGRHGQRCR
ncbi:MAG: hypothetical protein ACLQBL_05125, partial [Polyangiaceae bacterium]